MGVHCGILLIFLLQSHPTLCNPMDWNLPSSFAHGILQARTLEWVSMSSSRGSSQPKDRTPVSCVAGRFFIAESAGKPAYLCLSVFKAKARRARPTSHSCSLPGGSTEARELVSGGGTARLRTLADGAVLCVLWCLCAAPQEKELEIKYSLVMICFLQINVHSSW